MNALTPIQTAALAAACATFNDARKYDEGFVALTPSQYLDARITEVLDSYASAYGIGFISVYAFTERFQAEGVYGAIYEAAKTDTNVAALVDELRAKTDDVNLQSPKIAAGLGYLQSVKLLTADQAARIGAL